MNYAKELFKRIDALPTRHSPSKLFERAGLNPRLASKWREKEPRSWGPWLKMLAGEGLAVPGPGVSTIEHLGGFEKAKEAFMRGGYQWNQIVLWAHADPRAVENYKIIYFTLNRIENELHGSTGANAPSEESKTPVVA